MGKLDYEDPDRRVPGIALMNEGRPTSRIRTAVLSLMMFLFLIVILAVIFSN